MSRSRSLMPIGHREDAMENQCKDKIGPAVADYYYSDYSCG